MVTGFRYYLKNNWFGFSPTKIDMKQNFVWYIIIYNFKIYSTVQAYINFPMLFWRFTGKYLRSHWKHWKFKLSKTGYFFFSLYFILGKVLTLSYACCIAISLLTRSYVLPKKMKRRVSTTSDTQDQLNRQANYCTVYRCSSS